MDGIEGTGLTRVDPAAFADCMYLVGAALAKLQTGDEPGAVKDLREAGAQVPEDTVEMILELILEGDLPWPAADAMDAWLEKCRQAGAGDMRLIARRSRAAGPGVPAQRQPESEAEFQARLHRMVVDGAAAEEGRKALLRWRANEAARAALGTREAGRKAS